MTISLIVPVLNEEAAIPHFYAAVRQCPGLADETVEIVFVNDGSEDDTARIIRDLSADDSLVTAVNFSRNFGKEPALMAGLDLATGDAVVPIDVDLQDPIEVVETMIDLWRKGAEVVLARRSDRRSDGFLKRVTAKAYYRCHNLISKPKIEANVGDFRLMDRRVIEVIRSMPERNLFMKGLLSWVGFRTEVIDYVRSPRIAGRTKFSGWRLWNFALEGITSFSTVPLRLWVYLGLCISLVSGIYAGYIVFGKIVYDNPVPGYPSLMTGILFFGGVQLIGIGVLGEYIGRIYLEVKGRPRYVVSSIIKCGKDTL